MVEQAEAGGRMICPFPDDRHAVLVRGDCNDVLVDLVSFLPKLEVFDLILTDIPYGSAERGIIFDSDKKVKDFSEGWDANLPLEWVRPVSMLAKGKGASMFVFVPYLEGSKVAEECAEHDFVFKRPIVVQVKATACYPSNRKNLANAFETALFFRRSNGPFTWNATSNTENNLWTDGYTVDRKRIHPTQKSVSAFVEMIELTTEEGDWILDPFAGSCTSGVAAILTGRNWIGIEKNFEYAAKAWGLLRETVKIPEEYDIEYELNFLETDVFEGGEDLVKEINLCLGLHEPRREGHRDPSGR